MEERVYELVVGGVTAKLVMPAGAAEVEHLDIHFKVEREDDLRELVARLGGIERFPHAGKSDRLLSLYRVKGEGADIPADVHIWLDGDLPTRPAPPTPVAIQRMLDEAKEAGRAS